MTGSDRSAVLARVAEAVAPRARQHTAWERVGGPSSRGNGGRARRRPRRAVGGRGRLHGIRGHTVNVLRGWRGRPVRSLAMRVRIRASHVWRPEENLGPQTRPSTAC